MAIRAMQERYFSVLLEKLAETRYPSGPMLDRVEAAIPDNESWEEYLETLFDHIEGDRYPSPPMMARLNTLLLMRRRMQP